MKRDKLEQVACACGCGELRLRYGRWGKEHRFIAGHQARNKTPQQIAADKENLKKAWSAPRLKNPNRVWSEAHRETARANIKKAHERGPWNKGASYVFAKVQVYANKGALQMALRRLFGNRCMRCGWDEAGCDAHHIVPRKDGGPHTLANGMILCPNCHRLAESGKLSREALQEIRDRAVAINRSV